MLSQNTVELFVVIICGRLPVNMEMSWNMGESVSVITKQDRKCLDCGRGTSQTTMRKCKQPRLLCFQAIRSVYSFSQGSVYMGQERVIKHVIHVYINKRKKDKLR